ncbi:MAG TPA: hypothetical protein VGS10_21255 [Terracidiphilus sp.]|nr:hypothetical protein [Terracidiphilus sp.]
MAVEIEVHGRVSFVFPATGKTFSFSELVNLLGRSISIYELEGQSRHDHERAYYVVTSRNAQKAGREKNDTATSIYAPFMKGLTDRVVYGNILVCTVDELESNELQALAG